MTSPVLNWEMKTIEGYEHAPYREAVLGDFAQDDGFRFSIIFQPTCHRRGQWRLLIEDADTLNRWGCFDEADQPLRYYHYLNHAVMEAEAIAKMLVQEHG